MGKWGVAAVAEDQFNTVQPRGRRGQESGPGGASTGLPQGRESWSVGGKRADEGISRLQPLLWNELVEHRGSCRCDLGEICFVNRACKMVKNTTLFIHAAFRTNSWIMQHARPTDLSNIVYWEGFFLDLTDKDETGVQLKCFFFILSTTITNTPTGKALKFRDDFFFLSCRGVIWPAGAERFSNQRAQSCERGGVGGVKELHTNILKNAWASFNSPNTFCQEAKNYCTFGNSSVECSSWVLAGDEYFWLIHVKNMA